MDEARVEKLAKWMHKTYVAHRRAAGLGVFTDKWEKIDAEGQASYLFVARKLLTDPPACLTAAPGATRHA